MCGQLQCQGGRAQPHAGLSPDYRWEMLEANGTQLKLNCSWAHLDLGNDVAQPLLTLPGTACGPRPGEQPRWAGPGGEGCLNCCEQCPGLINHQCKQCSPEGSSDSHFRWSRVLWSCEPWWSLHM